MDPRSSPAPLHASGGPSSERRAEAALSPLSAFASLRAARSSAPALLTGPDADDRALRLSAAIAYQPPRAPGMSLALHLADPDRLASSSFMGEGAPLGLRAQDQARSLLLSAKLAL